MTDAQARPARGVRLGDLDRTQVHALAYVGRRWEVVGVVVDQAAVRRSMAGSSAGGAAPSTDAGAAVAPRPGDDTRGLPGRHRRPQGETR